jgi:hypothetical protein
LTSDNALQVARTGGDPGAQSLSNWSKADRTRGASTLSAKLLATWLTVASSANRNLAKAFARRRFYHGAEV